jgi:hypothetical protein
VTLKAPFPYFGGKRRAAPLIWEALGDPGVYIEPFAGSAAALLARPAVSGRRIETLNDADGWLVNTWRAIRWAPDEVAHHAAWPISEIDYHARLAWLQERRDDRLVSWLEGDPEVFDAKAAGWWLYVSACSIGRPWLKGPWRVVDGHLVKGDAGRGVCRNLPHLGNAGRGVHRGHDTTGTHEEQVRAYMRTLAARLERVWITCGSWERVLTPTLLCTWSGGDPVTGVLLDPPYSTSHDLYAETEAGISCRVREWCHTAPNDLRIVLCGYDNEHDDLLDAGWRVIQGKSGSGGGYSMNRANGRRERLWLSPACHHAGEEGLW